MHKLLIVEDDKMIADNLKDFFINVGYEAYATGNGQEALDIIEKHNPPILLIDLHLEGSEISGMEVLRRTKINHPQSKAIVLTGYGLADSLKDKCMKYGADLFLSKPITVVQLKDTVDNFAKDLK
jgi:CheY-like chemotaxis protein